MTEAPPASRTPVSRRLSSHLDLPPRRLLARRATAFAATAGVLIYLALDGGGYDIVARQQTGLVIWAVVAVGFALGVLPRSRPNRALVIPAIAAAGLLLWMLLSFSWTASDERTMAEIARLVTYLGVAVLAIQALNRHTFRAAAAGVSVAAAVVVLLAVASRLFPGGFPGATEVARQFRADRLDYPLDYWNGVAAWGAMTIAIGLAWSAHARLTATRALALAVVPVAGLCVYLTYSRGGAIGSAVAIVAVVALSRNRWTALAHSLVAGAGTATAILVVRGQDEIADATGGAGAGKVVATLLLAAGACAVAAVVLRGIGIDKLRLPRETARVAAPVTVVLLVFALVIGGRGPFGDAWHDFRHEENVSSGPDPAARLTSAGGNRNDLWSSAIAAFDAHPLDGIGPGTYEFWWLRDARDPEFVRDAHSLYLEQMAELGLPGLILVLGFLGGSFAAALKARRNLTDSGDVAASVAMSAAFAVFLVNAGVDWMWEETAVGVLALGGIAIAAAGGSSRLRRRRRRGAIARPGVRAALVAACLLAAAVEVPGLVSTQRVRASDSALRSGDLPTARQLAQDGIDAEPWAATPYQQLALVEQREGRLDQAAQDLRTARSKEPTNWRFPLPLAVIEAELGDRAKARRLFLEGRRLAPLSPFYVPFSDYGRRVFTTTEIRRLLAKDAEQGRAAEQSP